MKVRNILILFFIILGCGMANSTNPREVLDKSISALGISKGVRSDFKLTANGNAIDGTIIAKGEKFQIRIPGAITWYDGAKMWTLDKNTNECTAWRPTKSEVAETNPLAYLSQTGDFNVVVDKKLSSNTEAVLILTPKNPKTSNGVKNITVRITVSNYLPKEIKVNVNGTLYVLKIKTITKTGDFSDKMFKFDASKHHGVKVTEL